MKYIAMNRFKWKKKLLPIWLNYHFHQQVLISDPGSRSDSDLDSKLDTVSYIFRIWLKKREKQGKNRIYMAEADFAENWI